MNLTRKTLATPLVAAALILSGTAIAAEQTSKPAGAAAAKPAGSGSGRWKQPRTPWGDPDLQGTWPISHLMATPLQRDEKYGTRQQFTAE